jgi:hypothetical protein
MKTTSFVENLRHGAAMEISVSAYEGGNFIVTAISRGGERTTSVQLEYNIGTGERVTQVTDFSAPFDNAFYSALDAHMEKVAATFEKEEQA